MKLLCLIFLLTIAVISTSADNYGICPPTPECYSSFSEHTAGIADIVDPKQRQERYVKAMQDFMVKWNLLTIDQVLNEDGWTTNITGMLLIDEILECKLQWGFKACFCGFKKTKEETPAVWLCLVNIKSVLCEISPYTNNAVHPPPNFKSSNENANPNVPDSHDDAAHVDATLDSTHDDVTHNDAAHGDATHGDAPHVDDTHDDGTRNNATHKNAKNRGPDVKKSKSKKINSGQKAPINTLFPQQQLRGQCTLPDNVAQKAFQCLLEKSDTDCNNAESVNSFFDLIKTDESSKKKMKNCAKTCLAKSEPDYSDPSSSNVECLYEAYKEVCNEFHGGLLGGNLFPKLNKPKGKSEKGKSKTGKSKTGKSKTGKSKTGKSKTGKSKKGKFPGNKWMKVKKVKNVKKAKKNGKSRGNMFEYYEIE